MVQHGPGMPQHGPAWNQAWSSVAPARPKAWS
jgi:hypothetical protein